VPRFLREVLLPRLPIVFRPALRYAFLVIVRDIFVDKVDPPPDRRLAETQNQNRVWVGCLPVSSTPRLHNDLVRYDQQIASAELASPSRELAPGLAAHPNRDTSRTAPLVGRGIAPIVELLLSSKYNSFGGSIPPCDIAYSRRFAQTMSAGTVPAVRASHSTLCCGNREWSRPGRTRESELRRSVDPPRSCNSTVTKVPFNSLIFSPSSILILENVAWVVSG
jgi:hypothetical protein